MRVSLSFVLLHMTMIMIVKLDDEGKEGYDNHTYRDGDYDAEDGDFDVEDEFVF